MTVSLQGFRNAIAFARSRGQKVAELHVNKATRDELRNALNNLPDMRSPVQKLLYPRVPLGEEFKFDDIPVVVNALCEDGCVAVRPEHALGNDRWLDDLLPVLNQREVPWLRKADQEAPKDEDGGISLDSLISDKATPSDVLMKAMEGADRVKDVVVLRLLKNGDLDMSSSCREQMDVMRALQYAMGYLMNGGKTL